MKTPCIRVKETKQETNHKIMQGRDHVPYHVKEELKRWELHLDNHRKKIDGAKPTIDRNRKAFEMLGQLKRTSQYQTKQRANVIKRDNLNLLQKMSKIESRDDDSTRNPKFYEKLKIDEKRWKSDASSLSFMKTVREKEKNDISDEKTKLEGRINTEQKKQRRISKRKNFHNEGFVPPVPKQKNVDNIRPKVFPVKFASDRKKTAGTESYLRPLPRQQPKEKEKSEIKKLPGIGKQKLRGTHQEKAKADKNVKRKKENKNNEHKRDNNISDPDLLYENDEMIDGERLYSDTDDNCDAVIDRFMRGNIDRTSSHGIDAKEDIIHEVPSTTDVSNYDEFERTVKQNVSPRLSDNIEVGTKIDIGDKSSHNHYDDSFKDDAMDDDVTPGVTNGNTPTRYNDDGGKIDIADLTTSNTDNDVDKKKDNDIVHQDTYVASSKKNDIFEDDFFKDQDSENEIVSRPVSDSRNQISKSSSSGDISDSDMNLFD